MPASTRGKARDQLRFVLINPVFAYGWKTRDLSAESGISNGDLQTALGHMDVAAAAGVSGVVMVTGANAPKPMRVTKKIPNATLTASASVSTFCAYNRLLAANGQGFELSSLARTVGLSAPRATARTFSGVVTLSNGLKCVQPIDSLAATADRRNTLGIEIASQIPDTEARYLVRGSRSQPGRVDIALEGDVSARLPFSTDKTSEAGSLGSIVSRERIQYSNAAPV